MADYTQPPVAEKRVRFFDGQFLQDQDFIDEQKYHLDRERRQNRLLHVTGVADGLKVSATKANQVKVSRGIAVDSLGRQLVLAEDRTVDLLPAAKFNNQQGISLYILYQETPIDLATTGSKSERRWLETPQIVAATAGGVSNEPWDNQTIPVLLARLNLDNNGTITVDGSATHYAGLSLPGSVGIGTTEPAAKLHITGGKLQLDGNQQIKFTDGDTTNNLKLQLWSGYGLGINGGTLFYAANGNHSWRDNNGTNERMLLTTGADGGLTVKGSGVSSFAGNVGIGTSSVSNPRGWNKVVDILGSEHARLNVRSSGGVITSVFSHDNWNGARGVIGTDSNHPLTFATNYTHRMTIDTDGKVGIGLTSSGANLDVAGAGDTAGQSSLQLRSGNSGANYKSNQLTLGYSNTAQYRHAIKTRHHSGQKATNAIDFYVWNQGVDTVDTIGTLHTMTLDAGKVGIGTTSPAAKLSFSNVDASTEPNGIAWSDSDPTAYGIHRTAGAWAGPDYQQLRLSWRTGIILDPGTQYGKSYVDVQGGGLRVTSGDIRWGNQSQLHSDQGGSIELGGNSDIAGTGTPFIDFHFKGQKQDYNTRIINDADGRLSLVASTLQMTGSVGIGTPAPGAKLEVAGGGGTSIDFKVNGRLQSNNNDGGLWVASDRFVGGHSTNKIGVWAGNAWRLTVEDNGSVGIGTTDPGHALDVRGNIYCSGTIFANGRLVYWWGPDGRWKQIENRASDFAGSYNNAGPSDMRFKTDVQPIRHALEKVLQLRGTLFRWNETGLQYFTRNIAGSILAGPDATEEENQQLWAAEQEKARQALSGDNIGLIAQDVETIVPEVIHEDHEGYKYIRYQYLTALLVEAIKEQQAMIQALTSQMAALATR